MWTRFHICPSCIQWSSVLSIVDGAGNVVDLLVGMTCVFAGAFVVNLCVGVNVVCFLSACRLLEVLVESCLFSIVCLSSFFVATVVAVVVGTVVPGFSLNHVSPVQACPCRTLFCCLFGKFWNCSSKILIVLVWSPDYCPSIVLQFVDWIGHVLYGRKSAFLLVLWTRTRYPSLLYVQKSLFPLGLVLDLVVSMLLVLSLLLFLLLYAVFVVGSLLVLELLLSLDSIGFDPWSMLCWNLLDV